MLLQLAPDHDETEEKRFFPTSLNVETTEPVVAMIVKHLSDISPERVGDFKRWFLQHADRAHSLSVRYIEVDGMVPPHAHTVEETIFYIEGKGLASIGEKEIRIRPGTMLVIPPGTVHSSIREGLEPLRYLDISVGNPDL